MADFKNKIMIISGAGRGFGKGAAEAFGNLGAKLVLNDFDANTLADSLAGLKEAGIEVTGADGDIADEATSKKLVSLASSEFGGLDIALNNAGIAQDQVRLHETDSETAQRIVDVDLMGVFYAMKHQLPMLMQRYSETGETTNIVNVASAAGLMGSPKLAAYAAAKHGVVGLTRSAAIEYGKKGVRINALCPAFTRTRMVTDLLDGSPKGREAAEAGLVAGNPMGRLGEIDEVVQAMVWICSPENGFFNGQALSIDGGLTSF